MISARRILFTAGNAPKGWDTPHREPRLRRFAVLTFSLAIMGAALGARSSAVATPITVNLRVEGSTKTLFEGPVMTAGETIETTSSEGPHPCNYAANGMAGGFEAGGNPSGTPTTALHDAALATGLAFNAEWFGTGPANGNPGDFFITQVGPDINEKAAPFAAWGYAVNDTTAPVGGCQIALAPGNEVLWAYNYFNLGHLLLLSGDHSVHVGAPLTLRVSDGQTGEPIPGAAIGEVTAGGTTAILSTQLSNSNGEVMIVLPHAGYFTLKATRGDSVRSNGLVACVYAANDGSCGTTAAPPGLSGAQSGLPIASAPPTVSIVAKVLGLRNGSIFSRRRAPRVLKGLVEIPATGTLHQVRIRLERRYRGHCFNFSGSRESFVRARRCGSASFFSVGAAQSFSYLLPAPLPTGRYVYEIDAIDAFGRATKIVNGVSRVVFRVK